MAGNANAYIGNGDGNGTGSGLEAMASEVDSGGRMEFAVDGSGFGMLAEGDGGKLSFQGTRYLGFQRQRSVEVPALSRCYRLIGHRTPPAVLILAD
jgi:hypothetical protein